MTELKALYFESCRGNLHFKWSCQGFIMFCNRIRVERTPEIPSEYTFQAIKGEFSVTFHVTDSET